MTSKLEKTSKFWYELAKDIKEETVSVKEFYEAIYNENLKKGYDNILKGIGDIKGSMKELNNMNDKIVEKSKEQVKIAEAAAQTRIAQLQEELKIHQSQIDKLNEEGKQYEDKTKKAEEHFEKQKQLTETYYKEQIAAAEDNKKDLEDLTQEESDQINEIETEQKETEIKNLHDLTTRTKEILEKGFEEVKELKLDNNFTFLPDTDKLLNQLEEYNKSLDEAKTNISKYYDDLSEQYILDKDKYQEALSEKEKALQSFDKENALSKDTAIFLMKSTNEEHRKSAQKTLETIALQRKALEDDYIKKAQIYLKDKDAFATILSEKETVLADYQNAQDKINKEIAENTDMSLKKEYESYVKHIENVKAEYKKFETEYKKLNESIEKGINDIYDGVNKIIQRQIDSAKKSLEETEEAIEKNQEKLTVLTDERDEADKEYKEKEESLAAERDQLTDDEIKERETDLASYKTTLEEKEDALKKSQQAQKDLEEKKKKEEEKIEKLKKKQQKAELARQYTIAVADVAAGVAKAWSYGPIAGAVLSAIVLAKGWIEINKIKQGQAELEKAEQGGLLRGKRHSNGGMRIEGTNIEVEGGEYVINRRSTAKNLALLEYINSSDRPLRPIELMSVTQNPMTMPNQIKHSLESGGQIPIMPTLDNTDVDRLLVGMQNIKIEPRVSVTDINAVQDQIVKLDEWIGI